MSHSTASRAGHGYRAAAWGGIAIVIAVRLFAAWSYRYDTASDSTVSALISRHMARGERFAAFYYGQELSGTLEPAAGAVLYPLVGDAVLAANLGAALIGALMLPVAWALGRRLGGARAAAVAVALLLIGPAKMFPYHASAQNYAQVLTVSLCVLWAAAVARERWDREGRAPAGPLFRLGLFAGLALWTHPLAVSAVLAAGVHLAFVGRRLGTARIWVAPAGFLLGSLPWWAWNLANGFDALRAGGAGGWATARAVLPRLLSDGVPEMLGIRAAHPALRGLAAAALAGVVAWAVVRAARDARRAAAPPERRRTLGLLLAYLAFHLLIVSVSRLALHRSTGRYLTIAFPALAVLAGGMTAALTSRFRRIGWIPAAFLLALQLPALPAAWRKQRADAADRVFAFELRDALRARGIAGVYIHYWTHAWLNAVLEEEFCFWPTGIAIRHPPYWEAIERADRVAVLDEGEEVQRLLEQGGGACATLDLRGRRLHFDFRPDPRAWRSVSPAAWRARDPAAEGRPLDALSDRRWDTAWEVAAGEGGETACEVVFDAPREVCGARLLLAEEHRLFRWRLYGRETADGPWVPLTGDAPPARLAWTGPRPFVGGRHGAAELRFEPRRLSALRIGLERRRRAALTARVTELQVFEPAGERDDERERLPALADVLARAGAKRIYADRWTGHALERVLGAGRVIHGEPFAGDRRDASYDPRLRLSERAAIVVRAEDGELTAAALAGAGIPMTGEPSPPWTVFRFEPGRWRADYAAEPRLRWAGVGALGIGETAAPSGERRNSWDP